MSSAKTDFQIFRSLASTFSLLHPGAPYKIAPNLAEKRLEHFEESSLNEFYQLWGKDNVQDWDRQGLDIDLMTDLALELNLSHKAPHFGITPSYGKTMYEKLRDLSRRPSGPQTLIQIEKAIIQVLGHEESARRLLTFRRSLYNQIIAENYSSQRELPPDEMFLSKRLTLRQALIDVVGAAEATSRLNFEKMRKDRHETNHWWSVLDLGTACEQL